MNIIEPPTEGVTTPPIEFKMYLQGNEDGHVQIICTHPDCMAKGRTTSYNPRGLWLQDVGDLPWNPTPSDAAHGWQWHLAHAHGVDA